VAKQSIPTPEGVSIEVELAGLGSRTLALILDLTLVVFTTLMLIGFAQIFLAFLAPDFLEDFASGFMGGALVLLMVLGMTAVSVMMDGTTPGKRGLGLRVIGADGRPATALQHFLRTLTLLLDLTLGIGAILLFFGPRTRRLGDLVAGTIVVREGNDDLLLDPWLKSNWGKREARALDLTPGIAARFDEADLALLRDIILRRDMAPQAMRELHREAAAAYCRRARVEPTSDPRRALKDIFLFLRESRGL
jgi:uncharacterized RDD family membrane protein YckC